MKPPSPKSDALRAMRERNEAERRKQERLTVAEGRATIAGLRESARMAALKTAKPKKRKRN